jgi:hypothetical protein
MHGLSFCMLVSSIVIEITILLIAQILHHFVRHPVLNRMDNVQHRTNTGISASTVTGHELEDRGSNSDRSRDFSLSLPHRVHNGFLSIGYRMLFCRGQSGRDVKFQIVS